MIFDDKCVQDTDNSRKHHSNKLIPSIRQLKTATQGHNIVLFKNKNFIWSYGTLQKSK